MDVKEKLDVVLREVLGVSDVEKWWDSPNRALDMQTPRELLEYDPAMVIHYIQNQCNGYDSL